MPKYDVFISYARADKAPVKRIVAALEHLNLKVFLDEKDIPEFAPISDDLRHGLSQAKILLAYYSLTYPQRRACQWELTAAVIAGEGGVAGGTAVQRRVLVVNPLATVDHIEPGTLRDRLCFALPSADDDAALADLAAKVRAHVGDIDTPMTVRSSVKSRLVGDVWTRSPNRFVGRLPEMWDIHTNLRGDAVLLTADGGGHGMAQVQAWGGMGKSLLAEEYGRRFEPAWPGGLFWLKAGGADASTANWQARVEAQLINVIINLKPDIDIVALRQGLKDLDPETRVLVVRARVAELLYPPDERDNPDKPERPYLWVVDDLPHHTLIETLEAWAAPTPGGRTLFTTRDRGLSGVGKVIDLGVLKPEQAYRLLTAVRVPKGDAEEAAARQIVERLGSYPLAIDVAGQIVDTFATFADLLEVVSSPSTDSEVLAHELEAELPNGHASNIVATLQYSFQHAAGRNPQALTALRTLACLAPQTAVPLDLLSAMVGVDAKRAAKLLDRLSLLDLEEGAVSIHQIIARAIALDSPPDAMVAVKATAVKNFAWVMRAAADIREHRFLSPLIPHVVVLTERANSLDEAELLGWLARYHREAGQAALAEPICRQQMEVYLRRLGAEDRHTLASMHNLASSLRAQGDYVGAQLLQEQVLEVERRVLGEQHPSTLISISSLSATILEKGDHAGARELQELALKAQQGILGMSNLDTLSSMNNLAGTLLIQGEYDEARALQEQVLEVQRSVLGAEHPEYLTSLNNIALTFLAQGEHAQARALQEQVVEAQRHILGMEHPTTLISLSNLALTLGMQGAYADAQMLQERVVEAERRILGAEHPGTLSSMNDLATTLRAQGDYTSARALLEQVLEARRRVLGAEHPGTLSSMNNLALTLGAQGDQVGARLLLEQVVEAERRILGAEHPSVLSSLNSLALILVEQGDHASAQVLQEQVLEARGRVLGAEHSDTLVSLNNLALTLGAQGDHARAQALLERVVDTERRLLGAEHPGTLSSMNSLAFTLGAQGDHVGARALQEQVVEVRRRILGAEHPDTLTSLNNLAQTFLAQGEHARAQALQEQVVEARRRILGAEHPDTLTSLNNLAGTFWEQGECASARALLELVLEARHRVLGVEHPDTLCVMRNLGFCLLQFERARGLSLLHAVLEVFRRVKPANADTKTLETLLARLDMDASSEPIGSLGVLRWPTPRRLSRPRSDAVATWGWGVADQGAWSAWAQGRYIL